MSNLKADRKVGKRRWLVWLSGLGLVVVFGFALLTSRTFYEYAIILEVQRAGGSVNGVYDFLPARFANQVEGSYHFGSRVIDVRLRNPSISDSIVCRIAGVRSIVLLELRWAHISEKSANCIAKMPLLRTLDLAEATFVSSEFHGFRNHPTIVHLSLERVPLDGKALACVSTFQRLRYLHLEHANVSDEGIQSLLKCKSLRWIWLNHNPITDEGVSFLSEHSALERIFLDGTKITDESLKHLGNCRHLKDLSVARTAITDKGLRHLRQSAALEELDVSGVTVSDEAIDELGRHLVHCKIVFSGARYIPGVGIERKGANKLMREDMP